VPVSGFDVRFRDRGSEHFDPYLIRGRCSQPIPDDLENFRAPRSGTMIRL
jgi:hypothetical protein